MRVAWVSVVLVASMWACGGSKPPVRIIEVDEPDDDPPLNSMLPPEPDDVARRFILFVVERRDAEIAPMLLTAAVCDEIRATFEPSSWALDACARDLEAVNAAGLVDYQARIPTTFLAGATQASELEASAELGLYAVTVEPSEASPVRSSYGVRVIRVGDREDPRLYVVFP
jgi:hypothetical protein